MKLTLCIDKQSRNNPSNEIREYQFDIGYPLRSIDDVYDEIKIITDDDKKLVGTLIRRCFVDKYGVLRKLDEEQQSILDLPEITLFEGDNYVYIKEFTDLNMKIQYLTNSEMNKFFATKMEMNSSIQQTMDKILFEVYQKVDEKELGTKITQNVEAIKIAWNQISQYIQFEDDNGNASLTVRDINNILLMRLNRDGLNLYDSNGGLQTKLNRSGQIFYNSGEKIGTIGTAHNSLNQKLLSFLLNKADGLGWYASNGNGLYNPIMTWQKSDRKFIFYQSPTWFGDDNNKFIYGYNIDHIILTESNGQRYLFIEDNNGVQWSAQLAQVSDGRLKKNIKSTNFSALEKLNQIKFRQFDWKDSGTHQNLGYIAQELEKIDENLVIKLPYMNGDEEEETYTYSINNNNMITYLVKAVTELSKKVDEQQEQIDFLMNKLNTKYKKKEAKPLINEKIKQYPEKIETPTKKIKNHISKIQNKKGKWVVIDDKEELERRCNNE